MENSRHERAVIVAASYVIGFTSAFIAYGINASNKVAEPVLTITETSFQQPAAVANSATQSMHEASVHIEADGLVVATEKGERLLSANKNSAFLEGMDLSEPQSGIAEKIIEAELSRDSKYVYFCEQLSLDAEVCSAYIYDIERDVVRPVVVGGQNFEPEITLHSSAWSPNGYLNIGGYMSASIETPWVLQ